MIKLMDSPLAEFFQDLKERIGEELDSCYLLQTEAQRVWAALFGGTSRHLFELPDDSWFFRIKWEDAANWVEEYNRGEPYDRIGEVIARHAGWTDSDEIYFVRSRTHIIQVPFSVFRKAWDVFITYYDDSPILIGREFENSRICQFTSRGMLQVGDVELTDSRDMQESL